MKKYGLSCKRLRQIKRIKTYKGIEAEKKEQGITKSV